MFGRYFLIFLAAIALMWTAYVAIDIIDKDNDYAAQTVFGIEDKEVLVIHRFNEFDPIVYPFKTIHENQQILNQLKSVPVEVNSFYVSSVRKNILIESSEKWTQASVKKLFARTNIQPHFSSLNAFSIKNYEGIIYKNRLYLSSDLNQTTPLEKKWTNFDAKSSITHIILSEEAFQTTDLYIKNGGRIDFITKQNNEFKGNQVSDKAIFAGALPVSIDSYHFFEKEFLASNDITFKNGPMFQWVEQGFVLLETKGEKIIICDFKEGQNPINSMFDYIKQDPDNRPYGYFHNVELFDGYPARANDHFYVYNMDNFAVIGSNQSLCEEIVANYRLGNTLSQHEDLMAEIYGQLPSKVSERFIGKETKYSKAIYNKRLFETVFPKISKTADKAIQEKQSSYQSYKLGGKIHDFYVEKGEGNFIAITTNGFIRQYKNGQKIWEKHLNGQPVGKIQRSNWKEMPNWVITTKNGIHVLDDAGNYPLGFPIIAADKQLTTSKIYSWKGRSWALGLNSGGEILVFDQAGQRNARIKTGLSASSNEIEVWQSQGRIFYGVYDANTFKMFEAANKSEFRSFAIPKNSKAVKSSNELLFFAVQGDQLIKTDQKGNQYNLGRGWTEFQVFDIQLDASKKEIYITLWGDNLVKVVNGQGTTQVTANSSTRSIGFVQTDFNINEKTIVSVVDDIENDVYLYEPNGKLIGGKALEGSQKAKVTTTRLGEYLLSTIIDDFIIQHTIK